MSSHEMRKHLPALAMFVLPVIVVKLAAVMLGGGAPHTALADTTGRAAAAPATLAPVTPPQWSPKQKAAETYIQSLRGQKFGPPPFLYEKAAAEPTAVEVTPEVIAEPGVASMPKFTVSAVMSAAGGRRALINGKPYRETETIAGTTWIVAAIEPGKRSVTLHDAETDRSVTIAVEMPQ